jgi:hypothetical protein
MERRTSSYLPAERPARRAAAETGRFTGRPPCPGRLACHSMIRRGRHMCVRPTVSFGGGICPRARYVDTVLKVTPR